MFTRLASLSRRRPFRWTLYALALLALLGSARLSQQAWESRYDGERKPYLQMLSPTGVTIRWQTTEAVIGEVRYGESLHELDRVAREAEAGKIHEIRIEGLSAATRYYYRIGTASPEWFVTAPTAGSAPPARFWVIGDSGHPGEAQRGVRDAATLWMAAHPREGRPPLDFGVALGDNAYTSGRNREFQAGYFEPFAAILKNVVIWPVYGNHDARRWAFFDIFTLPKRGESGGLPSGTEHWYAFDYGDLHVVVLDSEESDRSTDGAMLRWLREDLAANRLPWLIALFHHPPYTKGSHDSDRPSDSGGRMREMRENALPLLEAAGVDLVLAGHSHQYERSHLIDCHYGDSETLRPEMVVERSGERPAIYRKGTGAHQGAIYAVVGASSRADRGRLDHPVMAVALAESGSLVVDVEGRRLDARYIDRRGTVRDTFTILKGEAPGDRPQDACPGVPTGR